MSQLRVFLPATLVFMGLLFWGAMDLPGFGDIHSPASTETSPRYIEAGKRETGAKNQVTAVLADYRGFDTWGEATVVLVAALGCMLILNGGIPIGLGGDGLTFGRSPRSSEKASQETSKKGDPS